MLYLSAHSDIEDVIELNLLRLKDSIYDFHLTDINILSSSSIIPLGKYIGKFGNHHLIMDPDTASWTLLDDIENDIYYNLLQDKLFHCSINNSMNHYFDFNEFYKALFSRGLVSIDGLYPYKKELYPDILPFHDGLLVELLVTEKCNMGCLYCQANAGIDKKNMTEPIAMATVNSAFKLNYNKIIFELSGGEPLLNFGLIPRIVREIEEKSSVFGKSTIIALATNGTLLTPWIAEFIKKHGIKLSLSLDGPDEVNQLSRPMISGRKVIIQDIINILRDYDIPLNILLTVNRHNVKYPEKIIKFLNELKPHSVKLNPITLVGRASENDSICISNTEYIAFIKNMYKSMIINNIFIPEFNLSEILNRLITKFRDYRCMRAHCNAGKSYFVVDSLGKIFPCAQMTGYQHTVLGNVLALNNKLDELSVENELINCFNSRKVSENIYCSKCEWLKFCEGGCIVETMSKSKVEFRSVKSPNCDYYSSIYSYIMEIISLYSEQLDIFLKSENFRYCPGRVVNEKFYINEI